MKWHTILWFLAGWVFSLVFGPSKVLGIVSGGSRATA